MSRPRAYQLIESASTVSTIVDKGHPPPATESQARPLAKLPPAEQPEAQPGPDGTSARTSAAVGIGADAPAIHLHVQSRERFRTYYRYSRPSEGVGSFLRGASHRMDRDIGRGWIGAGDGT